MNANIRLVLGIEICMGIKKLKKKNNKTKQKKNKTKTTKL